MPTKQETFDFVVKAMIKQGRKASRWKSGGCYYQMDNGDRCAAGHLLPRHRNWKDASGTVTTNQAVKEEIERQGYDLLLVRDLQIAHDHSGCNGEVFIDGFLARARLCARKHGLDKSVCSMSIGENP